MSLQYSSWDAGDFSKKKSNPSFGKPQQTPLLDTNDLEIIEPMMTADKDKADKTQTKIYELLEKMNKENFQDLTTGVEPIPPPVLVKKGSPEDVGEIKRPPLYATPDSRVDALANYRTIYSGNTTYQPDYINNGNIKNTSGQNNDILLEKLNYMIYLLEQQQNEKTDNVLEEFILYCFLGVFIIYVIDGFARSGNNGVRYVR